MDLILFVNGSCFQWQASLQANNRNLYFTYISIDHVSNTWGVQVVRYPNIFLREWKRIEAWKLLEETWLFFRLGEANNPRYGFKEKGFYFSTSFAFHLVFLLERNFTSLIEKNTTFYYCRPCQSVVRVLHEKLYCLLVPTFKTEHFSLCNFS